jgi:DNA polymerase elongation subunit (family B)
MIDPLMLAKLAEVKKELCVVDIETSAIDPTTQAPIDITTNFEEYVKYAKVKWIGMYSYKKDEYITDTVQGNEKAIREYLAQHKWVVGFNQTEFDMPVIFNNGLVNEETFLRSIDLLIILGAMNFATKSGMRYKNRGLYMGYKFKRNSLRVMAQTMGCETVKGDIDYKLFYQDQWTPEESALIRKYLDADVRATQELFEKTWDFWLPFAEMLEEKDQLNLSWITSSIASMTYRAACKVMGVEATFADHRDDGDTQEEMGGLVRLPKYEEARKVWYIDVVSLYPHLFAMFNLFSEVETMRPGSWHGNELFQVRGYYDISKHHVLSAHVAKLLQRRIALKHLLDHLDDKLYCQIEIPQVIQDLVPDKQLTPEAVKMLKAQIYTIKIFLNALYGAARSKLFEKLHKLHTENCGWDCCWLGQQVNEYMSRRMHDFGFETLAGDTDSNFLRAYKEEHNNEAYLRQCLNTVVKEILAAAPFPVDTFDIGIEAYIDYIMWPFSYEAKEDADGNTIKVNNRIQREWRAKKKNYLYLKTKKGKQEIVIMGMSIKKDDATPMGPMIFDEVLAPEILKNQRAKFPASYIQQLIDQYVSRPGAFEMLAREYRVKPATSYEKPGQIQRQISEGYFNGQDGVITLLKTTIPAKADKKGYRPVGRAGTSVQYCTPQEAAAQHLTIAELDLEKVENELSPFIERISEEPQ